MPPRIAPWRKACDGDAAAAVAGSVLAQPCYCARYFISPQRGEAKKRGHVVRIKGKIIAPLGVWLVLWLIPVPAGLNANQWHYFALFAAVITGLILESMPVGAIGLIGLTLAGLLGYVEPDPNKSLLWMLGGVFENTVWLIVGAVVFALRHRKNGPRPRVPPFPG